MSEKWRCQLRRSLPRVFGVCTVVLGLVSCGLSGWYGGWAGLSGSAVGMCGTLLLFVLSWQEIQAFSRYTQSLVGIAAAGFLGKIFVVILVNVVLVWLSVCYLCGLLTFAAGIVVVLLVQTVVLCWNQPPTIMPPLSD